MKYNLVTVQCHAKKAPNISKFRVTKKAFKKIMSTQVVMTGALSNTFLPVL
jgi:hypothetical protein